MNFSYLITKIKDSNFECEPFKHLYIENFLNEAHFNELISSKEIDIKDVRSDEDLFERLFNQGYEIIMFPGTTMDKDAYLRWHKDKASSKLTNSACEGFGVVLRLQRAASSFVSELKDFINSEDFQKCLGEKFDLNFESYDYDTGIQKYLDGYEISPHPDIRRKALTYMVNINPFTDSENKEIHTNYMKFNPDKDYVRLFWENNELVERAWVPWDWCSTAKRQTKNNSIVVFAPKSDTIHGVKASYDHLEFQRTQLYGNFWFKNNIAREACPWENLEIKTDSIVNNSSGNLSFSKKVVRKIKSQFK